MFVANVEIVEVSVANQVSLDGSGLMSWRIGGPRRSVDSAGLLT